MADPDGVITFSTRFEGDESPLTEAGRWHHTGRDWTIVAKANGVAYGTQTGKGNFDDSYAYLAGFPPNQSASAVLHLDGKIGRGTTHEVEILLRWSDSERSARGYECNFAFDGSYVQIVRWNGPRGDFTYLAGESAPGGGSVPGGIRDGDTVSAQIVGRVITVFVRGKPVATATDATFASGNPGIGFWRGGDSGLLLGDYGFTSYTANSLAP